MEEVPEKEYTISKAKGISIAYNFIAFILISFVAANNSKLLLIFLVGYILLGVALVIFSNGAIKFVSNSKDSKAGFTFLGIFLPSIILLLESLNYTLSSQNSLWLPFFLISAIVFILICFRGINRDLSSITGQIIGMLVVSFILGYALTRQINCLFDDSNPRIIHAIISDKEIVNGRSASVHYYLKLTSWDPNIKIKNIEVLGSTYDHHSIGNTIDVDLKPGFLYIPWYYITE